MKSAHDSQETIVKTKNTATIMATFHTRKKFKLEKDEWLWKGVNDYDENDIVPLIT